MDIFVPVVLSISAKGLADKDILSKSDPICIVMENNVEIGRTEKIKNNLNPVFSIKIPVNYYFEKIQLLEFRMRDIDGNSSEDLGTTSIVLSEIVTKAELERPLQLAKKEKGKIIVAAREIKQVRPGAVELIMNGVQLDKKDFMGKSDGYCNIYDAATNRKLFTTEVVKNSLNPNWKPFKVPLCEKVRIECFDWDKNSDHDLIGICELEVAHITTATEGILISAKGKKAGTIRFANVKFIKQYSFLEYIQTGTELSFAVAVDFTASNGAINNQNSLHFLGQMTAYEHAISCIGGVLEYYDNDKQFPVFGFGAKINGQVYHDFNLTLQPNSNVFGIQGILGAYRHCLNQVELYGPTNFAPIIRKTTLIAMESQGASKYFILLIVTDGEITDMDDTIEAIIDASKAPLSIVIVGVGNADFSKMSILDADDKKLSIRNKTAARDIVQFVAMRDFAPQDIPTKLPAALLQEIPGQLTAYMNEGGYQPIRVIE